MAKIPNGILGPISGKIGGLVAYHGKQGALLRKLPRKRTGKPSEKQEAQRRRFALVSAFLTPLRDLLALSFANSFISIEPFKLAASYNMKNAVCGSYPDYYIDYSLVWLSYGHLPAAASPSVSSGGPGKISFHWTDNSGQGKASPGDSTLLVIYCAGENVFRYHIAGAERSAGAETFEVPGDSGRKVHAWLGFVAKDGKDISPGIYAGEMVVE